MQLYVSLAHLTAKKRMPLDAVRAYVNDMNLKTKWQLDNNSRTMSSACMVEQQSSVNQQIMSPKQIPPCTIQENTLSHFCPLSESLPVENGSY